MEETHDKRIESYSMLALWNGGAGLSEDDYHEWYSPEHLLERLYIPGFHSACRYAPFCPGLPYFTYYLPTSIGVLRSPANLGRINNPAKGTRRNIADFWNMSRTACGQTINRGEK